MGSVQGKGGDAVKYPTPDKGEKGDFQKGLFIFGLAIWGLVWGIINAVWVFEHIGFWIGVVTLFIFPVYVFVPLYAGFAEGEWWLAWGYVSVPGWIWIYGVWDRKKPATS